MSMEQGHRAGWPQALRRYLAVAIVANLFWEMLQLPLYTVWTTGTRKQQAFAVVHCTVGDAMIAGLSLLVARLCLHAPRGRAVALLVSMWRAWLSVSPIRSIANG